MSIRYAFEFGPWILKGQERLTPFCTISVSRLRSDSYTPPVRALVSRLANLKRLVRLKISLLAVIRFACLDVAKDQLQRFTPAHKCIAEQILVKI